MFIFLSWRCIGMSGITCLCIVLPLAFGEKSLLQAVESCDIFWIIEIIFYFLPSKLFRIRKLVLIFFVSEFITVEWLLDI